MKSKPQPSTRSSQAPTASRHVRFPEVLDSWLTERARAAGYRNVQEKIIEIVRDAREAELREQEQAA